MPINLTNQDVRPTVTQARIMKGAIDADNQLATFEVAFGYISGGFQEAYRKIYSFTGADFTALVNSVPEVKNLRDAVETYIATNKIPGVKI